MPENEKVQTPKWQKSAARRLMKETGVKYTKALRTVKESSDAFNKNLSVLAPLLTKKNQEEKND